MQGQAAEIANAFTFAHTEAVRRGKPVFVVPGSVKVDGKLNGAATDWSTANALLVFTDNDATNNQTFEANEDLRVVTLNDQVPLSSITQEALGSDVGKNATDNKMTFVYYSNGQMRIKKDGTTLQAPGAIARIVVKDKNRKTKNQVTRFCEVIRVDATGRSSVYTGKRSELKDDKAFFYCE